MSSKITQKAVLFSSDKQIHFSGAIHRVDTKGGEKYGTLQRISCMAYLFTPYLCGCSGRSGAAFHAFLERPRPLLQLPAPRLVENQRETGVDGSGRKGNW